MVAAAREASSLAVTAAAWPFGFVDEGIAELRRLARTGDGDIESPVLLIHGFAANKSNWMFIRRYLRAAGFSRVHCVNYNPFRQSLDEICRHVAERARDLMALTGSDHVHLVGHSMGGFVARYAVQVGGLEEARTVVSIASPHQGAPLAALLPTGVRATAAVSELAPNAAAVRRLRATARPMDTRFIAFYSDFDALVPGERGAIAEAALKPLNILVPDEGHLSIALSRRVAQTIVDQLMVTEGDTDEVLPTSLPGTTVDGPAEKNSGKVFPQSTEQIA